MRILGVLLLLMGCPAPTPGVSAECAKAYDKCKLASGPLGVCEPIACDGGPCFRCQGQH